MTCRSNGKYFGTLRRRNNEASELRHGTDRTMYFLTAAGFLTVALSIDLIFRLFDQRDVIVQVVSRNEIKNMVLLTLCAIVICKRTEKTSQC